MLIQVSGEHHTVVSVRYLGYAPTRTLSQSRQSSDAYSAIPPSPLPTEQATRVRRTANRALEIVAASLVRFDPGRAWNRDKLFHENLIRQLGKALDIHT
jgi:hypothetical protein